MKRICVLLGTLMLMAFFQNCQQATTFSSKADGSAKATGVLTPVDVVDAEDGDQTGQITQPADPTRGPNNEDKKKYPDNPVTHNDDDDDDDDYEDDYEHEEEADHEDGRLYVCILEGSGKSIKLGMINGALAGQNQIPNVLCMSRKACLEIAGAKFDVLGAFKRGYCKEPGGNPHVANISDADLKEKVDRIGN